MDKQSKDNLRKEVASGSSVDKALAPAGWRRHLPVAAVGILVLTAVMGNVTRIWNDDDPWHLAAGQRMLQNLSIATTDTFAYPYYDSNPQRIWVNVHWLFQVAVAGVHAIGGYELLSVFKGLMGGLALLIFGLALYRRAPAAWVVLCGLLMIHYISIRLRIRPEMFSFVFLMLTITIVDGVAAGRSPKLLWWLVPIQLVWVNMHALYILGIAIIWSGLIFAVIEKRLGRSGGESRPAPPGEGPMRQPEIATVGMAGNLASMNALVAAIAATIACFISPWPVEGPMQAFVLHKDISGRSEYLTYGISEFLPLWNSWTSFMDVAILAVLVLFVIALLAVLELLKLGRPRLPIRHVVWMAAFIYLAGTARRNVALLGPLLSYLLALHGGQVLTMIASVRPRLAGISHWLAAGAIALALATAALYIPRPWKWFNIDEQFGLGMQEGKYPVETAKFLGEDLKVPGVLLCDDFGAASTYIYYGGPRNNPNRLLYMDGRVGLKVHTLDRFIEYTELFHAMRKVSAAREMKLPDVVRFITVQNENKEHLSAMSACTDRFRLVFLDPVSACFARLDWPGGNPLEGIPERSNLSRYDKPLEADGFVRDVPHVTKKFFLPKPFSLNSRMGEIFLTIGNNPDGAGPLKSNPVKQRALLMATRYLAAAANEGVENRSLLLASLAQAFQQLDSLMQTATGLDLPAGPSDGASAPSMPVHLDSARALCIYNAIDWSAIDQAQLNGIIIQQIRAMLQAGMADCADAEMGRANKRLSGFWRVNPPQMYADLDNRIKVLINQNRIEQTRINLAARPLLERATILASPRMGMTDQAIAELQAADTPDAAANLLLGDLLLNKGLPARARECYALAAKQAPMKGPVELRLALCDWVEGNYHAAVERLAKLPGDAIPPLAGYYRACMLVRLGLYDQAGKTLANVPLDGAPDDLRMGVEFLKNQVKEFRE
ncbi:MAG: hypothetical protein HZA50_07765 [Planctomycetes bacterium]|nr:hypothetical protein [Planctomycetota bacterium]